MTFIPGQRYTSDREPEQGVGTIISLQGKSVTVFFPATQELRTYSTVNCSLSRLEFFPGDKIQSKDGWYMTVTGCSIDSDIVIYQGIKEDGCVAELSEINLLDIMIVYKPQDKLLSGQMSKNKLFSIRYQTLRYQYRLAQLDLSGLIGPRTSLIAHQLHIAQEVAQRYAPRVMLADEVGMGKTIEAGLIIHQQLITERATRILIVVPEALLHQWLVEMLRRFNLRFALFNDERYQNSDLENAFLSEQLILCGLDFLTQDQEKQAQAAAAGWDTLIVDEAHHLICSQDETNKEYQCIKSLSEHALGLLLLTATPEQMGAESYFSCLRLLDENRFHSFAAFQEEEALYIPVAKVVKNLLECDHIAPDTEVMLIQLLGAQSKQLIDMINQGEADAGKLAKHQIFNQLIDRHGTGRILFKNTRAATHGFPQRKLYSYPQPLSKQYHEQLKEHSEQNTLTLSHVLFPETTNINDNTEISVWWKHDARIDWLMQWSRTIEQDKILVICSHTHTAMDLHNALRVLSGIRTTLFHEKMTIIERDRSAAYFADLEYGAQIMICSEIGSEGRNFQFSHHLILFDLPAHPDLLEQRIGRLDRIGQKKTISIHVPYLENTGQAVLFHWYDRSLNAFVKTCTTSNALIKKFGHPLNTFILNCDDRSSAFDQFIKVTADHHNVLKHQMQQGKDQLLEFYSHQISSQKHLMEGIIKEDNDSQIKPYLENLLDCLGVDSEEYSDQTLVVRPSNEMLAVLPSLPHEGMMATFARDIALSREDMHFFTWEHPFIRECMNTVISTDMGRTAVALLENKALKMGTVFLEVIHIVAIVANKSLQLQRYFPPTPIRLLIDQKQNNLAKRVTFDTIDAQLTPVNKGLAKKIINLQKQTIKDLLGIVEKHVNKEMQPLIDQACAALSGETNSEINRLLELKKINPNVRETEIMHLQTKLTQGIKNFKAALPRLDSIRLLIVT